MSNGCSKCGNENPEGAVFCRRCGAAVATSGFAATEPPADFLARPTPPASSVLPRAQMKRSLGWGALVIGSAVALAGSGFWWLGNARSAAAPSFDSAPPPSVLAANSMAASAAAAIAPTAPFASPAPAASAPTSAPVITTSAPASELWEPAGKAPLLVESPDKPRRTADERAAREAKAKAVREQRARAALLAEADLARRRTDEIRARGTQPPAAPVPAPRLASPTATETRAPARTVQDRCANRGTLLKAICEARECVRAEHAAETVCQRIRAADDRRREQ